MDSDVDPYAPTAPGATPPAADEGAPSLAGRTLGGYEILRELGRGGMGVVYLARDAALEREVAVKVLHPRLAADPEFEKRFVREARTAAALDHPGIVPVHTAGRDGDVLFIAMQLVRGETLDARLRRAGPLPVREALDVVRQAAQALQAAHEAGLVHRDIKPNNIMIDPSGRVKVMDFGLMRSHRGGGEAITEPGVFYGTPEYASPEQCEIGDVDGRADLYSLGAVLYEMLTGRRPHTGETPLALFKKIVEDPPVPVRSLNREVTAEVARLVERMMAKKPGQRIGSAKEVAAEIDAILAGTAAAVAPRRTWLAAALLGTAALAAAALFWAAPGPKPGPVVPPGPAKLKLVVFDLKNGIPKPDTAWYSIALSDMLIAALAGQAKLDVPTRDVLLWKLKEMELAGKASEADRRVLTGELGARAYLSGTYYVQNGRIRLTVAGYRLPGNDALFPALSFDGREENLFGLVDQAAAAIARAALGEAPALALVQQQREAAAAPKPGEERKEFLRSKPLAGANAPPPAPAAPADADKGRKHAGEKALPEEPAAADAAKNRAAAEAQESDGLTRAFYESRRALESARPRKEDFERLAEQLRREFGKADGKSDRDVGRLDFACPACDSASKGLSRCAPCGRFRVLRLPPSGK